MTNYKRIIAVLLTALMAVMCFTGCAVQKSASAIGSVNGEDVTSDYFQYFLGVMQNEMVQEAGFQTPEEANAYWDTEIDGKKAVDVLKEKTFDEVSKLYVEVQKAKELGLELTSEDTADIESSINEFITQSGGKPAYEASLKELGLTDASYRSLMEMFYYSFKLENKIKTEDEQYKISEEEIKAYADSQEKITAKHILFATTNPETGEQLSDEQKVATKALAEETLAKIKNGEADFDETMTTYSQDPGLVQNPDGYTFGKGEMVKEFEDAAFNLKENEISGLVETMHGFHIIKRVPKIITDADLAQAEQDLQNEIYEKEVSTWKDAAKIEFNEKSVKKYEPSLY